jgi:hypothetical protein
VEDNEAIIREYKVKVAGSKKPVKVHAEYYRVDEKGTLVFRISHPMGSYPTMVKTFASGHWLEIE